MDAKQVPPPGERPTDPYLKEIDPVAFALERLHTYLIWIAEHHATYEATRVSNPEAAEQELAELARSTVKARQHLARLTKLILAGHAIDPSKRLPRGLAEQSKPRDPTA